MAWLPKRGNFGSTFGDYDNIEKIVQVIMYLSVSDLLLADRDDVISSTPFLPCQSERYFMSFFSAFSYKND